MHSIEFFSKDGRLHFRLLSDLGALHENKLPFVFLSARGMRSGVHLLLFAFDHAAAVEVLSDGVVPFPMLCTF